MGKGRTHLLISSDTGLGRLVSHPSFFSFSLLFWVGFEICNLGWLSR